MTRSVVRGLTDGLQSVLSMLELYGDQGSADIIDALDVFANTELPDHAGV